MRLATSILEDQLNQLQINFHNFTAIVYNQLLLLDQYIFGSVEDIYHQINSTYNFLMKLNDMVKLLTSNMNALERKFSEHLNTISNNTTTELQNLNKEVVEEIMNASDISLTTINTLTDRLASGIRGLHIFDSCAAVSAFPIQLPSGMYYIRSGDSIKHEYCSFAFSCNSIPGKWRRIAYLNTSNEPCPDRFEVRSDTSNPPLCRRLHTSAGCSSVIYPSNGMSYSQVCGTVRIHPAGTPDGFASHNNQVPRNGQLMNQNYVDGVSLTYRSRPDRKLIWTYTAAVLVRDDSIGCGICNIKRPIFSGANFTCTTAHCNDANNCYPDILWGNEAQQCIGNETFYRQLSESSTDNIEMRVCRDQDRSDEDILLSLVEIYVI